MKRPGKFVIAAVTLAGAFAAAWRCGWLANSDPRADLEREFEQMAPDDKELGDFGEMEIPFDDDGKKAKPAAKPSKPATGTAAAAKPEQKEDDPNDPETLKLAASFNELTDAWSKPDSSAQPTLKDVEAFVAQFRKVPPSRKDDCMRRALNLIPDGNVMLLAGVLMDKSQSRETIDAVFGDILNRDAAVKTPVLREVLKDTEHPCWNEAARILDVTGQLQRPPRQVTTPATGPAAAGQPNS